MKLLDASLLWNKNVPTEHEEEWLVQWKLTDLSKHLILLYRPQVMARDLEIVFNAID